MAKLVLKTVQTAWTRYFVCTGNKARLQEFGLISMQFKIQDEDMNDDNWYYNKIHNTKQKINRWDLTGAWHVVHGLLTIAN